MMKTLDGAMPFVKFTQTQLFGSQTRF